MSDARGWLDSLGLGQYAEAFEENAVDLDIVPNLTEEHLRDLGVSALGHRLRILAEAKSISAEPDPPQGQTQITTGDAERRQLTVMFCDLVGSTALSEQMDLEPYREMLGSYQSVATSAIRRYDGYIARYMGDGLLTYFGYPTAHEDDAERAIRAALDIVDRVCTVVSSAPLPLQVRIGIATGLVVAGDIVGEGASEERAVLGETPNLAARLQGIAEPNQILIAESTRQLTRTTFEYRDLGPRELKGLTAPQPVLAVRAVREASSRFEATRRVRLSPLVGRNEELELLSRRWSLARKSEGQVVLLSGEPGIGKSRLIEAFLEATSDDDSRVLRYQCSPHHINSVLYPVTQHLQMAAGLERGDSPEMRLDKLVGYLGDADAPAQTALFANLLSIPFADRFPPIELTPQQLKQQTLRALLDQLQTKCMAGPVVLLFEDLHWMDPTSSELLAGIVELTRDHTLLTLLTFRPEYEPPWVGDAHVTLVTFNRLNRQTSFELISANCGGKSLPDELALQIVEKTDGVPLFVEELTQAILESGLVREGADAYALTGALPPLAVPDTLQESLTARLDALDEVRGVAQTAAALGREFSLGVLRAVLSRSDAEMNSAITRLLDSGLVIQRGPEALLFKHALIRDAAYDSLLRSRRKSLHSRIAETLEKEFPETVTTQPELLAYHYTEAGLVEPALSYWEQAGSRAVAQCAYPEAISHLENGLELIPQAPIEFAAAGQEISLRILLGVPLMSREGWASSAVESNYRRVVALSEESGESESLFPALWGLWMGLMMRSKLRDACTLADQLLEAGTARDDQGLQLQAHHSQWTSRMLLGELSATLRHTDRGIELYRADQHHALTYTYGGHDAGVCARQVSSLALWLSGYPEQARERLESGFELADKLRHLNTLVEVLAVGMILAATQRDAPSVADWTERLFRLTPEGEYETYKLWANGALGWTKSVAGEPKEGLAAMRGTVESWLKDGVSWTAPMLMLAATEMGRHGATTEGIEITKRTLELARRDDTPWFEADILRVMGELTGSIGGEKTEESVGLLQQALDVARAQGAKSLELRAATSLARIWRQLGKQADARDLLNPIYGWFKEGFDSPDLTEARLVLQEPAG